MSTLTDYRNVYRPMKYPWAYDMWKYHERELHWWFEEVPLADDVKDWNTGKLTEQEKKFLTQIFRFFTNQDVDIASAYIDKYLLFFKQPEVRMMLMSMANREAIHIAAYDALLQTLGLPDSEYKVFKQYAQMVDKHEYFYGDQFPDLSEEQKVALNLAKFSAFGEGVQLFSSFLMLQSFAERGLMRGMGQMITWSARDEDAHCTAMCQLFCEYIKENPHLLDDNLKRAIYQTARDMADLEFAFVELAFDGAVFPNLDKEDIKDFIKYLTDRRLLMLGLKPNFGQTTHAFKWFTDLLLLNEHANFFEIKSTAYSLGGFEGEMSTGDW